MGEWNVDGQKVRDARRRAALTLRELADQAGISYVTLHRIETAKTGEAYPTTLRKIADALGVAPVDLMSEGGPDA